jgi:hypothetical protein
VRCLTCDHDGMKVTPVSPPDTGVRERLSAVGDKRECR